MLHATTECHHEIEHGKDGFAVQYAYHPGNFVMFMRPPRAYFTIRRADQHVDANKIGSMGAPELSGLRPPAWRSAA
jgi:hypothetical protein